MRRIWNSKLSARQIKSCIKYGYTVHSESFRLRAMYGMEMRIVLVASKKAINKRAVLRNFAKRRIRAALDQLKEKISIHCMLFLNPRVLTVNFVELVAELQTKLFEAQRKTIKTKPVITRD